MSMDAMLEVQNLRDASGDLLDFLRYLTWTRMYETGPIYEKQQTVLEILKRYHMLKYFNWAE